MLDKVVKRTWQDIDEIALDLVERYPQVDPLTLKFPQLRAMVTSLPTFADDPGAATDEILEAIQATWYDKFED